MKIKAIAKSEVTNEDLKQYKEAISKIEGISINANDVDIDKRIITLCLTGLIFK